MTTRPLLALAALVLVACGERVAPVPVPVPTTAAPVSTAPVPMTLVVDATDLPRGLLHARVELPAKPGTLAVWYPKWIPGTHAPSGPIQNLGGFRPMLPDGTRLAWRRDEAEPCRFEIEVPPGASTVAIGIDYICNQPSVNSEGIDSYASDAIGIVSWNTCLVYPEGVDDESVRVHASVSLPAGWRWACPLTLATPPVAGQDAAELRPVFAEASLREVVDSPLLAGMNLTSHDISAPAADGDPALPISLHVCTDRRAAPSVPRETLAALRRQSAEIQAMLDAPWPFQRYLLYAVFSDRIPGTGLEHLSCSVNVFAANALRTPERFANRAAGQLAHELMHAWCGKHCRPAGMYTRDLHTAQRTSLLWVYEGLDMWLGEVLPARAGFASPEEFAASVRSFAQSLALNAGREWRSLEDTATANWLLRAPSEHWSGLRRDQDYYLEGMLFWMEVDAIIRDGSGGARSLDDVVADLLRVDPTRPVSPFDLDDVVAALSRAHAHDWRALIRARVQTPSADLPFHALERCGWRVRWAAKRPVEQQSWLDSDYIDETWSLGMTLHEGRIRAIMPHSPADRARLAEGMRVLGIAGEALTPAAMDRALAASATTAEVRLRVEDDGHAREVTLVYDGGPRYFEIERIPERPDYLAEQVRPRSAAGRAFRTATEAAKRPADPPTEVEPEPSGDGEGAAAAPGEAMDDLGEQAPAEEPAEVEVEVP